MEESPYYASVVAFALLTSYVEQRRLVSWEAGDVFVSEWLGYMQER